MKRNLLPIIGSLLGMGLIIWAININGEIVNFVDISSILITVFGSFCALMISFPYKTLLNIPNVMKNLLITAKDNKYELILLMSNLSRKARMEGLLALEDDMVEIDNDFLTSGLQMVIDGVEPDIIKDIMELRLATLERRHRTGQEVFEKWGELAPAFGMLGTLIGLIVMLTRLDDPSNIGPGMATALITTFYGSLMANLVFIPIASNLSEQTDEEIFVGHLIIDGLLEIQAGSNPRILEEKLTTYLSPEERELFDELRIVSEAEVYE
ncbi:MAG TPA: MotA/TolQ/ExbB proton channel family protein [Tissierellaceae bacterium]|nr:MotA/TolQ/ExbB proton channel family protein [Tissierellaceae bacterium]